MLFTARDRPQVQPQALSSTYPPYTSLSLPHIILYPLISSPYISLSFHPIPFYLHYLSNPYFFISFIFPTSISLSSLHLDYTYLPIFSTIPPHTSLSPRPVLFLLYLPKLISIFSTFNLTTSYNLILYQSLSPFFTTRCQPFFSVCLFFPISYLPNSSIFTTHENKSPPFFLIISLE
jgi:hypothetical protein